MASELDAIVSSHDLVVFTSAGCPHCARLTRALDAASVPFAEVDYAACDAGVREAVRARHRHRSAPAVFARGRFVGGCNDGPEPWMGALKLLRSGRLQSALTAKL